MFETPITEEASGTSTFHNPDDRLQHVPVNSQRVYEFTEQK